MKVMKRSSDNLCVLIVDDDEDDQMMLAAAFRDVGFNGGVETVNDGEELMEYLENRGAFSSKSCPHLILLDLNMPKKDGRLALKEIRRNSKFCKIPVIIYSTSKNPEDVSFAYENGANSFISKPSSYQELKIIAAAIEKYWFGMVQLPPFH
jgi:CheY-like chemotaxis protein